MQKRQQKHQEGSTVTRPSSYNLDSKLSTTLFQRIMLRLKVQKVIKHWKKLSKNSINRYKRLQQWVLTQKSYIQDLKLIQSSIQRPLRQKQLITQQQQRIIFPNMSSIIMLSQQMYQSMRQLLQQWDPLRTQIAPAVMKLSNFFKIYIEYFRNYQRGKEILMRLSDDKEYKAIVRGLRMDVDSYLIKPTQRPVKYKLLLTDYQKKLRRDHPDYNALTKAIDTYHQVVEKTNQALQNQQLMRKMIIMQQKFKNILQSSRQWKFQFQAYFEDNQKLSNIYVFTDLILVVQTKQLSKQRLLSKIFLDNESFVQAQQQIIDEKRRRLFIAGRDQVAYFSFLTVQLRNQTFHQLARIINSLHVNQQKRKAEIDKIQSRRYSTSYRGSKPYYVEDYYQVFDQYNTLKKKFRVTVSGVHRRCVKWIKNQYFVIKLQLPFPQVISQRVLIKFQELIDLEKLLWGSLNKWALVKDQNLQKIHWQPLITLPRQLSKCSQLQQQSKVLQYRSMRIQSFLNFVLRNRQTLKTSNLIFYKLKMFQSLYQRIIDEKNECENCAICEHGEIISSYQAYMEEEKMRLKMKQQKCEENLCIERSFHCQNRLASVKSQVTQCTIDEILLVVNSKLGYINQSLTNRIIQGDSIKIDIYIPDYKDIINEYQQTRKKWITIDVYKKDTVGNLLEVVRKKMGIKSVRDFGIVLVGEKQNVYQILHEDEYVIDLMKQYQLDLESSTTIKNNNNEANKSTFRGFFSRIKQKFESPVEQKHIVPKIRLELRKVYHFPTEVEQFTCLQDPQRYHLLSQLIFYSYKSKQLNLHHTNIVKLCSLFICIQYNNCFHLMRKEEINRSLMLEVLPQSRLHVVNDNFLNQVWKILSIYVQKGVSDRNLFSAQLIELLNECPGWNMQFFMAQNLQQSMSLPQLYLKIGINNEQLLVMRQNNYLAPVLRIKLQNLTIRYSGYLVLIEFEQRQYRFLCSNLLILRTTLQKYELYNRLFLGKNRVDGRPLMEENV